MDESNRDQSLYLNQPHIRITPLALDGVVVAATWEVFSGTTIDSPVDVGHAETEKEARSRAREKAAERGLVNLPEERGPTGLFERSLP